MTATASFKSLSKDGTLKKADLFRVAFADLSVEPGFNLRIAGAELDAHVDALAQFILSGGQVPPLEVRIADDGRVLIVDGHCRYAAFGKALAAGAPIEYIDVLPFRGNDADRVARVITSASGKQLSLLEVAFGYKRLSAFNLTPEQIAAKFGKTRQHVDQALILAHANADVHALVVAGTVSATVAIDAARKHGEGAGAFLAGAAGEAAKVGKKKVTAGTVKGKPLPRKIIDEVEVALLKFAKTTCAKTLSVDSTVVAELLDIIAEINATRTAQATKAREAAAKRAQGDIVDEAAGA